MAVAMAVVAPAGGAEPVAAAAPVRVAVEAVMVVARPVRPAREVVAPAVALGVVQVAVRVAVRVAEAVVLAEERGTPAVDRPAQGQVAEAEVAPAPARAQAVVVPAVPRVERVMAAELRVQAVVAQVQVQARAQVARAALAGGPIAAPVAVEMPVAGPGPVVVVVVVRAVLDRAAVGPPGTPVKRVRGMERREGALHRWRNNQRRICWRTMAVRKVPAPVRQGVAAAQRRRVHPTERSRIRRPWRRGCRRVRVRPGILPTRRPHR